MISFQWPSFHKNVFLSKNTPFFIPESSSMWSFLVKKHPGHDDYGNFCRLNYKVEIVIMVERYQWQTFWCYLYKIKYEIDTWKTISIRKWPFLSKFIALNINDYFRDHQIPKKSEIKGGVVKNTTWWALEFSKCSSPDRMQRIEGGGI